MMKQAVKNELLQLTQQKDGEGVKALLQSLDERDKGGVFEWYLGELYKGNGWLVEVQGGRGDLGADILLYHPKTPSKVSLIVQTKNHANPLTFDQTKIELVKFEQQAASKYNCQQFNLIAVNSFVKEAQKLSEFNMVLSKWAYVVNLIEHSDPDNITEPEIELYAHNKDAYEKARELWLGGHYVAVVQATGTGKSFLIAKVLADFLGENNLVMAPSNYILDQQKFKVPWATQSTTFMTYAKGANLTDDKIKELDVKLIVLDEFHRCGAKVWGTGVQRLLDAHPEACVFGTTATPIRYLDNSRDMSDELFGGVVAVDLSLAEAIIRKILPDPNYIVALYTLNEEIEDLMETREKSSTIDEEKKNIVREIDQARLSWEQTSGIPQILKKHLKSDINKFIVFCKDQEHLDEMEVEVQKWFQNAGTHRWRKVYRVLSADPESDRNLKDFKNAKSPNTAHLLFAIDMLNEGLHIPDVGAVILLRPTESPTIFYQQIGRCLQVGIEHTPIIFDFVNNFQSIHANDFLEDLEEAKDREREKRAGLGLEEYAPVVYITDETKDIVEVFERISERLLPWEVMFQQLVEFKKAHGHCDVPDRWPENPHLSNWVSKLSSRRKKGQLSKERIRRLDEIGFIWDRLEANWDEMFAALVEFKEAHGHCNVPNWWLKNPKLSKWVSHQRSFHKKGKLSEERISRLDGVIGFQWQVTLRRK